MHLFSYTQRSNTSSTPVHKLSQEKTYCPTGWWKRPPGKGQEFLQIQPPRMWVGRSAALSLLSFLLKWPRTRRKNSQTLSSMVLSGRIGTYCKCRASYNPSFQWCPLDLQLVAFRRFAPASCIRSQEFYIRCLGKVSRKKVAVILDFVKWGGGGGPCRGGGEVKSFLAMPK